MKYRTAPRPASALAICTLIVTLCALSTTPPRAARGQANADPVGLGERLAGGREIGGATGHRLIHFTFDDGPDPRTTAPLLDTLDRHGIKATFFFSASRFRGRTKRNAQAPELAREALRRGHSVGSHSVDHVRMGRLDPAELRAQLDENERLFERVFGQRTYLFRPPFGSSNRTLDRMLAERGYTNVLWNIGLADWVERPPKALLRTFRRVLARNEAEEGQLGGVVLLHDTHSWTVEAVDLFVDHLQARNCELLRDPSAELYDIVDDLSFFHTPLSGARPGEQAPPAAPDPEVLARRQARLRAAATARCGVADARP